MFDSDYCSLLHPKNHPLNHPVMVLVVHADDVSDFVDDVPQVVHTIAPGLPHESASFMEDMINTGWNGAHPIFKNDVIQETSVKHWQSIHAS